MNNYQKLSRDLQTIWSASQGYIVETRKSRPKVSPFLCWNFSRLFWLSFAPTICPWVFEDVWRVGQVWKSSLLLIVGNLALLWACGLLKVFFSGGGGGRGVETGLHFWGTRLCAELSQELALLGMARFFKNFQVLESCLVCVRPAANKPEEVQQSSIKLEIIIVITIIAFLWISAVFLSRRIHLSNKQFSCFSLFFFFLSLDTFWSLSDKHFVLKVIV